MGNILSSSHRNDVNTRGYSFSNIARTFNSLRRMLQMGAFNREARFERGEEFDAFERLLGENFSIYNTSDSERGEHLVTIHVSCYENRRECTIYISAFNDNGERILDATINQDLTRNLESECFVTFIEPQTGREFNTRFASPISAKAIKEFLLAVSRPPQQNA